MVVRLNEPNTLPVQAKTLRRILLKVFAQHTTANTALVRGDIDLNYIQVKVHLSRKGQRFQLLSERLLPVAMEAVFQGAEWDYVLPGGTAFIELVTQAVGVKHNIMVPTVVDLGVCYNLRASDVLEIEVTAAAGLFSANVDASTSFVEVDIEEAVGVETHIEFIRTKAINGGESRLQHPLGDNVLSCHFINTDKSSILTSSQVIDQFTLTSDKRNCTDNYREQLSKRLNYFREATVANTRYQSFPVLPSNG